jgi:flagellar export protein FliJ
MSQFKFRAAAALDLRRRREDLAQRARAEAQAAVDRAELALGEARGRLADAVGRAGSAAHDPALRIWYRNWIARQKQEVARRSAMAADRRIALEAATARLQAAHKDVRVLERLQDRLHAAWTLDERRKEQKELDWLASIRHTLAVGSHEEVT